MCTGWKGWAISRFSGLGDRSARISALMEEEQEATTPSGSAYLAMFSYTACFSAFPSATASKM